MTANGIAFYASGDKGKAVAQLGEALALAEPGGFIRLFVDEGPPTAQLLSEAAARGIMPDYVARLLAAFEGLMNLLGLLVGAVGILSLIPGLTDLLIEIFGLSQIIWYVWLGIVLMRSRPGQL